MGLKDGCRCAMWSIEDKGGYAVANLSTSKKKKDSKEYETDWRNGFVWLVDRAYENLKGFHLSEGEYMELRLGRGYERTGDDGRKFWQAPIEVTNNYVKEKNREYTNYRIFDAEPIVSEKSKEEPAQPTSNDQDFMSIPDNIADELPFK